MGRAGFGVWRKLAAILAMLAWAAGAHATLILVDGTTSFTETVKFGGIQRTVTYIRPVADSTDKVPLLVMLHYGGGTGEKMGSLTEVSEIVRDAGIWVMLPDGIDGGWNNDPANDTGIDDLGFLSGRINNAIKRFPIAKKKVYMVGYSNGGFMSLRFACEKPQMLAAIATVAAELRKSMNCAPAMGTPLAMINGTDDQVVPYDAQYGLVNAPATATMFAGFNGCTSGPARTNLPDIASDGTTVYVDQWTGCTNNMKVSQYTVVDGGHTWPDSPFNYAVYGNVTKDINGTLTAWDFLKHFTRKP